MNASGRDRWQPTGGSLSRFSSNDKQSGLLNGGFDAEEIISGFCDCQRHQRPSTPNALGDRFTPEVQAAWREAYALLAAVMRRAAARQSGGVAQV